MFKQTVITLTTLTAISLLSLAPAHAGSDLLRCAARQMRAQGQYYDCTARCDNGGGRRAARPACRATSTGSNRIPPAGPSTPPPTRRHVRLASCAREPPTLSAAPAAPIG